MRPTIVVVLCFFASLLGGALGASLVAHPEWFGLSSAPEAEAAERKHTTYVPPSDEDLRRRADEDAKRRADEEARRKADEDARRRAQEEAKREEQRRAEDRRKAEEERRRAEEESRRRQEDARRRGDEKGAEEERRRDEARRREEDEARRRDEARRGEEDEARRRELEEAHRREEEQRRTTRGVTCDHAVKELKGAFVDQRDCFFVSRVFAVSLETARDGSTPATWRSASTGSSGSMRILGNVPSADGMPCRRFEQSATVNGVTRSGQAVACYRNNAWAIVP